MAYDPYRRGATRGYEQQVPLHVAQRLQEERDLMYARLQETSERLAERDRKLTQAYGALDALQGQLADAIARTAVQDDAAPAAEDMTEVAERYKKAAEVYAADLANLRRRMEGEVQRVRRDERVTRLRGVASLHDALSRSLTQIGDTDSDWYRGNDALLREVTAELSRAGATPVGLPGERFDPNLHEAVGTVPAGDHEPDSIVFVEQTGFRLPGGELVRPARVVVAADPG